MKTFGEGCKLILLITEVAKWSIGLLADVRNGVSDTNDEKEWAL